MFIWYLYVTKLITFLSNLIIVCELFKHILTIASKNKDFFKGLTVSFEYRLGFGFEVFRSHSSQRGKESRGPG